MQQLRPQVFMVEGCKAELPKFDQTRLEQFWHRFSIVAVLWNLTEAFFLCAPSVITFNRNNGFEEVLQVDLVEDNVNREQAIPFMLEVPLIASATATRTQWLR